MSQTLTGVVTSTKGDKTITITVHETLTHPLYKKRYSMTKKFRAHDEKNEAGMGDLVEIISTRPMSKTKRFMLKRIVKRADEATLVEVSEENV